MTIPHMKVTQVIASRMVQLRLKVDYNTTKAQRQPWSDYLRRRKIARPLPFLFFSQPISKLVRQGAD